MTGSPDDGFGSDLRLKHRGHRLRLARHSSLAPVKLRCVDGRQMYCREPHPASIVQQLAAQRVGETSYRVLGAAVRPTAVEWRDTPRPIRPARSPHDSSAAYVR